MREIHLNFTLMLIIFFIISINNCNLEVIRLTEDNHITIRGPINAVSSSKIINELIKKKNNELYIFISSNGGSVTSGMNIIHTIQALQKTGTKVICIGNIALSMGFVIFQYCDTRLVLSSSILMQHQMSLGIEGPIKNVNSYMKFVNFMNREIENYQADRLNLTLEKFKKKTDHDWWMYGSSAINNLAADKLVNVICDFKIDNHVEKLHTIYGQVYLTYSTCPLSINPIDIKFDEFIPPEQIKQIKNTYLNMLNPSLFI